MRTAFFLFLLPSAASAHSGHLADLAGHDHWVLGAALGAAAAAAAWAWVKDKDKDAEAAAEDDATEETEAA